MLILLVIKIPSDVIPLTFMHCSKSRSSHDTAFACSVFGVPQLSENVCTEQSY